MYDSFVPFEVKQEYSMVFKVIHSYDCFLDSFCSMRLEHHVDKRHITILYYYHYLGYSSTYPLILLFPSRIIVIYIYCYNGVYSCILSAAYTWFMVALRWKQFSLSLFYSPGLVYCFFHLHCENPMVFYFISLFWRKWWGDVGGGYM